MKKKTLNYIKTALEEVKRYAGNKPDIEKRQVFYRGIEHFAYMVLTTEYGLNADFNFDVDGHCILKF